ncbi:exocyst complex component Sec3-domain-containing protein [Gaertneriomyces semiglobifer]|nr:exocyst complex component Sec3-domain-containing protein [Gaertneriomyces semiglobifer]
MDAKAVKRQLSTQLFVGLGGIDGNGASKEPPVIQLRSLRDNHDSSSDKYNEQLILNSRVWEENKKGGRKARWICITVKKNMKYRIHKVKQSKSGYSISKSWGLDDIKLIEDAEDVHVTVNLGKTYRWSLDDKQAKSELLYTLMKLCRRYLKRLPKLVNINEDALQTQMKLDMTFMSDADKAFSTNLTAPVKPLDSTVPEVEEDSSDEEVVLLPVVPEAPQVDLDEVLNDFNWQASRDAAALEARLLEELQALEVANVHAIISSEEHANNVVGQLDKALSQLGEIEEWISHYTRMLDAMGQDVHQIEISHKGMQITSENQKLLLKEVETVLASLYLPGYIIEALRNEPLNEDEGIQQCEEATERLMEVVSKKFSGDVGNMQAVKERLALLNGYGVQFAARLQKHLNAYFQTQADSYMSDKTRTSRRGSLKLYGHESIEEKLYRFRRLLTWLKDVDTRKHYDLQMSYVHEMGRVYARDIHEFIEQLKLHHMRRIEESMLDYVFIGPTSVTISVSSAATTALKSTVSAGTAMTSAVTSAAGSALKSAIRGSNANLGHLHPPERAGNKRSKLRSTKDTDSFVEDDTSDDAASIKSSRSHRRGGSGSHGRGPTGVSMQSLDVGIDERMWPDEALEETLQSLLPILVREQNFITDLFSLHRSHKVQSSTMDLTSPTLDTPTSREKENDGHDDLDRRRPAIKDLKLTKRIQELVQGMFEGVREEILDVLDAGVKADYTFAIGMMARLEPFTQDYQDTSHTYVLLLLEEIQKRLQELWDKFIEDQMANIDSTKVTSKKRSGILLFVRTFPKFVDRMESFLGQNYSRTRKVVNEAYAKIIKTIMVTLDAMAQQVANDPKAGADDKEHLNIHILHVENMHHFYSELRARKVSALDTYVKQAKGMYDIHLDTYCKVVIRKPLGKLWDFFDGVESLLKTNTPEEVNYHVQYNRSALKEVLKKYPGKEIKKGLESLYKRVEKHYPDEDGLLQVIWRGIQEEFAKTYKRYEELIGSCYPEANARLEFTLQELLGYFSELARAH